MAYPCLFTISSATRIVNFQLVFFMSGISKVEYISIVPLLPFSFIIPVCNNVNRKKILLHTGRQTTNQSIFISLLITIYQNCGLSADVEGLPPST